MLKKFEVEGFRNFGKRFVLDLSKVRDYQFNGDALKNGLVKCGIIYGRNAVGKTNLCNALFDIKRNVGAPVQLRDEANYLCADCESNVARFSYTFDFDNSEVVYAYSKKSCEILVDETLVINGRLLFSFNHENGTLEEGDLESIGAQNLNWDFRGSRMSVFNYICNNIPVVEDAPIFETYRFVRDMSPISDSYLSNRQFVSNVVDRVIQLGWVDELQSFLNRFGLDCQLVVCSSPSGERVLYFQKHRLVPFCENCSSGTIALLRLFNYFRSRPNPSLVFIDEFDAFYHFDLAESLIRYFKENNVHQVICASHNTDLFSNKILRPDCLFILSNNSLVSSADATLRELREGNNLEKLYKAGEFDE